MSSSTDYRPAGIATAIAAGDTIRLTIAKGIFQERGTFAAVAREHAEVPGLLIVDLHDREIVAQRPDGSQPFQVEVAR